MVSNLWWEDNWICIFEAVWGCMVTRESKDNKTTKIADFVITKEIAMEYMKKRYPGYHMRPSRWKDIKISVHI